jgi:GxxExxY protein
MEKARYEELAKTIFEAALEVHRILGPGLLEGIYHHALLQELNLKKTNCKSEVLVPLKYKGVSTGKNLFIDILVEDEIILELKSVDEILPVHMAQLLSYMKLTNKKMGFLLNFNVPLIKEGVRRIVYKY